MTELKKKAEEYADTVKCEWENDTYWVDCRDKVTDAYIAGATENGFVYHDLRKNSEDLPDSVYVKEYIVIFIDSLSGKPKKSLASYSRQIKRWWNPFDFQDIKETIIAWAEVPDFEVEL